MTEAPRRITHWIDGKPWSGVAGRTGEVFDPARGVVTGRVDLADDEQVDEAVAAARRAFDGGWRHASLAVRTQVMFAFRELLHARAHELAEVITSEHGKVVGDAAGEVQRGLEVVELACGIPTLLQGEHSAEVSTRVDAYSIRQPLGVAAVISPFNFPAMVPLWFLPLAIACGNAVVLKPSERDPSAAVWLAETFAEAGLPPGVLNVLHGDAGAVDGLLAHPDVTAISFVGSTSVARHVYATAAAHGKRVQALGGAKNHMVVLRTPISISPPMPRSVPGSAARASAAWRSRSSWQWTPSGTSSWLASLSGPLACARATGGDPVTWDRS
jgi:malonate-semialdehyde dehydrogenase (acetylating) / methylmalonate-semialdehyde dehydrogenase